MGKTLLYRLFGLGKIPKRLRPTIEQEGVVLMDEGIPGSVIFRNFRAPGRRYSYRRNWFTGSLVMTEKRFWAFTFFKPVIRVPFEDEHLKELQCSIKDEETLCVVFDVSRFHEGWTGSIECRFSTPKARLLMDHIIERTRGL